MKVNFVSLEMKHHAAHSGYHQLCRYFSLEGSSIKAGHLSSRPPGLLSKADSLTSVVLSLIAGMRWYPKDRLLAECRIIPKIITRRQEVFHFIYGEDSYRYAGLAPRLRGSRIVCTYHQPPEMFRYFVKRGSHVRGLDAVVAIASNQVDFFAQLIPREKIFLVPHGIDTAFFRPLDQTRKAGDNKTCLFVGNWLRDFQTLREVIRIVNAKQPRIQFVIVTLEKNFAYFRDTSNVFLASNLSDEELLWYYQSSSILLQPLTGCTANNAILEGLACGLPIIVTDVGGVRDYVDETCAVLVRPRAPEFMAEQLIGLLEEESRLQGMSENSRKRALEFNWLKIANKMGEVYEMVLGQ